MGAGGGAGCEVVVGGAAAGDLKLEGSCIFRFELKASHMGRFHWLGLLEGQMMT